MTTNDIERRKSRVHCNGLQNLQHVAEAELRAEEKQSSLE